MPDNSLIGKLAGGIWLFLFRQEVLRTNFSITAPGKFPSTLGP